MDGLVQGGSDAGSRTRDGDLLGGVRGERFDAAGVLAGSYAVCPSSGVEAISAYGGILRCGHAG